MGGTKDYIASGGFVKTRYHSVGETENGIKILKRDDAEFPNTPAFSNTPYTLYATRDSRDGNVNQVSMYGGKDGRQKIKDIDTAHEHRNPDGTLFSANEIHVHTYRLDESGNLIRSKRARKPSSKERRLLMEARYGKR